MDQVFGDGSVGEVWFAFRGDSRFSGGMKVSHPVLSCAQGASWEKHLLDGDEKREWEAMRRAGCAIGFGVLEDWRETGLSLEGESVLVLVGKGHNGGDALIAVTEIFRKVSSVRIAVLFTSGERSLRPLVARAWRELQGVAGVFVRSDTLPLGGDIADWLEARLGRTAWAVCLDGVLGLRFKPPLRPGLEALLRWINGRADVVLRGAVDLPSGVGDLSAAEPFRADFTYMPGFVKFPLLTSAVERWAGRLRYLDLGFFEDSEPAGTDSVRGDSQQMERRVIQPAILRPLLGLRDPLGHKVDHGHLFLVGGCRTLAGAILMSVLAAVRSGVGLVTAFVPQSLAPAFAARAPEAMWVPCPETPGGGLAMETLGFFQEQASHASAMVLGPGLGKEPETHALAREILKQTTCPVLLDADGLTSELVEAAVSRAGDDRLVLTPHGGEFVRVSGMDFKRFGESGLLTYARQCGAVLVFKGPPFTRVTDGRALWYALNGGPVLARGGSGDVLSGLIGGFLAGRRQEPLLETVSRAVFWQGDAADNLAREQGVVSVVATDLIRFLGKTLIKQ